MLKGNKVWTPNGYQSGPVNSLVGKGESIIDYTNGTGTLVTKGKVGVDNQPSSVSINDNNVIAGNDIDWSNGMKFSDQVAPLTAKLQMYNNIEKRAGKKSELSSLSKQTMELQKNQLDRAKAPILQAMKNITDRQERQRRKIFNAQQKVNLINQVNQSSAATEGLTQQYYLDNGNTYDDVLYANRGKDLIKPRYVKRK